MRAALALAAALVATPLHVAATIRTPTQPIGVAYGAGAVWTASFDFNGVLRIDPRTNAVTARIKTGRGPIGVAYGAGSVWVANWSEDTIARVSPATGRVVARIRVTARGPEGMAFGGGQLWVSNKSGSVSRIDPATTARRR